MSLLCVCVCVRVSDSSYISVCVCMCVCVVTEIKAAEGRQTVRGRRVTEDAVNRRGTTWKKRSADEIAPAGVLALASRSRAPWHPATYPRGSARNRGVSKPTISKSPAPSPPPSPLSLSPPPLLLLRFSVTGRWFISSRLKEGKWIEKLGYCQPLNGNSRHSQVRISL